MKTGSPQKILKNLKSNWKVFLDGNITVKDGFHFAARKLAVSTNMKSGFSINLKTFLAANRESTYSSHEYESESSGVDFNESEVLEPLDLSTSKEANEKFSLNSAEFSTTSITREHSSVKTNEPIEIDNDIHQSDFRNNNSDALDLRYVFIDCMQRLARVAYINLFDFSLKSPTPTSTPNRKIISKRNLSNPEFSTSDQKLSDASILKRRRLSDEFREKNDFGLEAERSSLEVVKRLSRQLGYRTYITVVDHHNLWSILFYSSYHI